MWRVETPLPSGLPAQVTGKLLQESCLTAVKRFTVTLEA